MKFTILQQDLWPKLQSVARSCGVRSQLPVLGNVLLQTSQGKLKLSATNLEIGVVKIMNTEVVEDGEVTIPAKTLVEVVANLSGEKLEFTASVDQIEISTATFSSKINGIPAAEFPTIPLMGKEAVVIEPEILIKSLPQVTFAAAASEGRLTGILVEIKDKKLQLVATDGYRLAHKVVPLEKAANFRALVPRRTLEEVARLISEEEVDNIQVSISDDQNQMIFSFGNTQVSSRLIEGQFPAWEKIIPAETKARVVAERGDVLKAVKLASVFTRNEANVVTLQNQKDKLVLTSAAKEIGNQKKEVEAQGEGEDFQISFNTKFLIDALSAISTTQVIIELSGPFSAALIKPVGEEGLQYIIMPVNLS